MTYEDPCLEWRSPHEFRMKHDPEYRKLFDDSEFERQKAAILNETEKREVTPPAPAPSPTYSTEQIHALVEGAADGIRDALCDVFHEVDAILSGKSVSTKHGRLATALDSLLLPIVDRLEKLEAKTKANHMAYRGIWGVGSTYQRGDCVTDHGSVWYSVVDNNTTRPGADGQWTLMVKRGSDGKDAA